MKKFFINASLFSLPIVVWITIVVVVDPFNYFNVSPLITDHVKQVNAKSLNRLMFNMIEYNHDSSANLLIGDSRSNHLRIDRIEEITGEDYFLLNSNALKLNESFELYWFACRHRQPDRIFFTVNFNMFNKFAFADRVVSVDNILRNPLLYIFDRSVAETCWLVSKASIQGKRAVSSTPPMSKEEFWDWNIRVKANDHYGKYEYPDSLYSEMKRVVEHARDNGTEVTLIIVPHHVEMQKRVGDYGLTDEMTRFKKDMFDLGVKVYDFDYPNKITREKGNFEDPIHFTVQAGDSIIEEVWNGRSETGRILTGEYIDSLMTHPSE